ncbi:thiamine-binding protein [Marmoricola sp. URHB0036]|uniref:thiamine-binding protein n=1 Tax=Marmoricola sp. URHB0036 TaxID=1298863 RepID=UPI000413B444|nr:thiamine-binding protein [Marmoricola sp. URHB0036]
MLVAISISPTGRRYDFSDNPDDAVPDPGGVARPEDADGGVSDVVAEIVRVIRASGLSNETNAMFTNIEGEWDEVMAVVKQAVDVAAASYPRVGLVLKADIRPGYDGQLSAKVERVEEHLRDG